MGCGGFAGSVPAGGSGRPSEQARFAYRAQNRSTKGENRLVLSASSHFIRLRDALKATFTALDAVKVAFRDLPIDAR